MGPVQCLKENMRLYAASINKGKDSLLGILVIKCVISLPIAILYAHNAPIGLIK